MKICCERKYPNFDWTCAIENMCIVSPQEIVFEFWFLIENGKMNIMNGFSIFYY